MKNFEIIFCFILSLFATIKLNGQDLINLSSELNVDSGITSAGSTVFSHVKKMGLLPTGEEFSCGVGFTYVPYLIYTISQQSDLIYFESFYDSSHVKIKEQGYYRLLYINEIKGYCWQKDLIWNLYDENGKLIKKEYYDKNKLIETPQLKQPIKN